MTSEIRQDRLEIKIGRSFDKSWPVNDSDTAGAYDPTGCLAVAEVRASIGGPVIVRFASDNSGLGSITFDTEANMTFHLDKADTVGLSPISNVVWDCSITDTDGDEWPVLEGAAFITRGVTGG